jgi:hypothetical protein
MFENNGCDLFEIEAPSCCETDENETPLRRLMANEHHHHPSHKIQPHHHERDNSLLNSIILNNHP